ncbi:hypothetical protein [Streptomyces althioticus]|uniref:hypothetical protein n=1 Tax=Streptomyces althioticus TaxID=83380 RepID=UPI0033B79CD0
MDDDAEVGVISIVRLPFGRRRLAPLRDRHINFLGRYLFNITASGPGQGLRPFRDPDAVEDGEDEV